MFFTANDWDLSVRCLDEEDGYADLDPIDRFVGLLAEDVYVDFEDEEEE